MGATEETPPRGKRSAARRDLIIRDTELVADERTPVPPETGTMTPHRREPPTLPFRYFKLAIERLKKCGTLPHQVNRSAWPSKQFWSVGSEIVPAFRFLILIDHQGRPLPSLTDLIASLGTEDWPERLASILIDAYPEIVAIGITRITPKEILVLLRERYAIDAMRGRMATAFFIHALRDAALDHGPFLPATNKERSRIDQATPENTRATLLAKLPPFDEGWNAELKLAWLTVFSELVSAHR